MTALSSRKGRAVATFLNFYVCVKKLVKKLDSTFFSETQCTTYDCPESDYTSRMVDSRYTDITDIKF